MCIRDRDTTSPSFPVGAVTFTNGAADTQSITYYNATTGRTVEADDTVTTVSGTASSTFTVQANVAQNYLTVAGTPQTAGVAFNVTITARDDWENNLGADYTAPAGTYIWTTTAGNAPDTTAPSLGTLAQGDFSAGVATKSVTLYNAEAGITFTASEPGPSTVTGTSSAVTVDPAILENFAVVADTPVAAGACVTANSVTARDNWENVRTTDTSLVNMTNDGAGVTFYTAGDCLTSTTQYTLAAGTVTYYFDTDVKQTGLNITATKDLDTPTGVSGDVTVEPAATAALLIRLPGQSFVEGTGITCLL